MLIRLTNAYRLQLTCIKRVVVEYFAAVLEICFAIICKFGSKLSQEQLLIGSTYRLQNRPIETSYAVFTID